MAPKKPLPPLTKEQLLEISQINNNIKSAEGGAHDGVIESSYEVKKHVADTIPPVKKKKENPNKDLGEENLETAEEINKKIKDSEKASSAVIDANDATVKQAESYFVEATTIQKKGNTILVRLPKVSEIVEFFISPFAKKPKK